MNRLEYRTNDINNAPSHNSKVVPFPEAKNLFHNNPAIANNPVLLAEHITQLNLQAHHLIAKQ